MSRLAVSIALVLGPLVFVVPVLPYLTTALIGDGGDGYQFLGFQYIGNQFIEAGRLFGHTDYWRYPAGIQFQSAADSMLFVLLGVFFYRFRADPILVYNLSVLALLYVNLSLSYIALRTWFDRRLSMLGAVIYGLSFYSLAKVGGHVNLVATAGFPLFFAALYRIWRDGGRWQDFARLTFAAVFLALSSLQYPLILLGGLPFVALAFVLFERAAFVELCRALWAKRLLTVGAVVTALLLVVPFHGVKLAEFVRGETVLPSDQLVIVPPVNFALPNQYTPTVATVAANATRNWIEYSVFVGFAELALLACALHGLCSKWRPLLAFSILVLFVLSLGRGLYPLMFGVMPYRGIIEPARFYVLFYLGITVLILAYLRQQASPRLLLAAAIAVGVERLPMNVPLSRTFQDPALVAAVREKPTAAVLDLPLYTSWWNGNIYDLYSVHYQRPIVAGYFHWSADRPETQTLTRQLHDYGCYPDAERTVRNYTQAAGEERRDSTIQLLEAHDIRVIVLHKYLMLEQCAAARDYINTLLDSARLERLADTDRYTVLWLKPATGATGLGKHDGRALFIGLGRLQ